jgi:GC-rich sequence DNA-binding factor
LGKKSRKVEARKRREEMNEMIIDAYVIHIECYYSSLMMYSEEQDEETMEWEQEQLRRGGLRQETPEKAPKAVYKPAPSVFFSALAVYHIFRLIRLVPTNTPIPDLDAAIARLKGSLTSLTASHQQNTASMSSLAQERAQLEKKEQEMRDMIVKAEEKRSWFAAFREWVESVATFLDEKVKYPCMHRVLHAHRSRFAVSSAREARARACLLTPGTIRYGVQAKTCR